MSQDFNYTVSLTRVSDGKTVEFTDTYGWETYVRDEDWERDPVFIWEDGNFSCNCNRFLFFERALGLTEEEIDLKDPNKGEMGGCGLYEKYRVNWIRNEETQNIIYEEKL